MKKKPPNRSGAAEESAEKAKTAETPSELPLKKNKTGRAIVRAALAVLLLAAVIGGAVLVYSSYTRTHYEVTFYQETSGKVSRNIRLVVIADIHDREYGEGSETLIGDVRALEPDLILFAGDMVLQRSDDYEAALHLVSEMSRIAPCYGVLGNHETERIWFDGDEQLPERFEQAGLKLLRNACETVQIGSDAVRLIGVEGTSYGFEEYGGRQFMDGLDADPEAYTIVMTHIPILFDAQLSDYDFDLGIAGHVHGGIVNIPYFGGLVSGEEGLFPAFYAGRYTLSRQQPLLISRGLGDSSALPRINNMPELMVVDINWC